MLLEMIKGRVSESQLSDIQVACNHLMVKQFFYDGPKARTAIRNALTNNLTRNVVKDLLFFNGYDLISDEPQGWWGVIPQDGMIERPASGLETLVLLVLATTYTEAMKSADVDARQNALISFQGFYARMEEVGGAAGVKINKPSEVKSVLEGLKSRQMLAIEVSDDDPEELEITVRPMILRITGPAFTKRLDDYMAKPREASDQSTVVDMEDDMVEEELSADDADIDETTDAEVMSVAVELTETAPQKTTTNVTKFARPSFI